MLLRKLPAGFGDANQILKRRDKAAARKDMWRDLYREAYDYTMPQRETFNWHSPGQRRGRQLYDATGQECVELAANNAQALLCPSWKQWCQLSPGADIDEEVAESQETTDLLQDATGKVFHYLNHSNFSTVVPECFLDLQVGTCALVMDEGDDEDPIVCDSIPLSALELEEGPNGSVQTQFMKRTPAARNLVATFPGLSEADLPQSLLEKVRKEPDTTVEIIQGFIYWPKDKTYYGVAIDVASKSYIWRYHYGTSCPVIVARTSVTSGEIYGRGPVIKALPNIKTLNAIVEYLLRHSALQVAPPLTAVSDGVVNPYTLALMPNTVIPVASNDNGSPSIRVLEVGGEFIITEALVERLQEQVRRTLLGDTMSQQGPVKSATEIAITDRNRLWNMGSVYGRLQSEFLSKVIARVVFILQRKGKLPPMRIDGKMVTLKYVSPLARAQDQEDLIALQQTMELSMAAAQAGGQPAQMALMAGWKFEDLPAWLAKRTGMDADLIRSKAEQKQMAQAAATVVAQQAQGGNVVPMRQAA